MEIRQKITPSVIQAATAMLSPYIPELSPVSLVDAIKTYSGASRATASLEKPLTRKQAAELLCLSLPTVNRLLNRGTLRRIVISSGTVRIAADSVKDLLEGRTSMNPA